MWDTYVCLHGCVHRLGYHSYGYRFLWVSSSPKCTKALEVYNGSRHNMSLAGRVCSISIPGMSYWHTHQLCWDFFNVDFLDKALGSGWDLRNLMFENAHKALNIKCWVHEWSLQSLNEQEAMRFKISVWNEDCILLPAYYGSYMWKR